MTSGPMPSPGRTATFISEVPGKLRLAARFEGADLVGVTQRETDLVETVHQAVFAERVDLEAHGPRSVRRGYGLIPKIYSQLETGKGCRFIEQAVDFGLGQHDREKPVLEAVVEEDVGERRRDDAAKAVVHQCPGCVLARGATAEVLARKMDRRAVVARLIENEVGVAAPGADQRVREAGALDRLEMLLRDDLIGVDVRAVERRHQPREDAEFLHQCQLRMSTKCPAMAAAAAITGLTRWVRPPVPCRPSKLRFEVDAQRSPAPSRSGFMPRHIEHPGSRHSKPASRKTRSSPSFSACAFTRPEPGTTSARRTFDATRRPLTTAAAARRSSMRELVHEPMKILSSLMSVMRVRGLRPM